ncbi:MAG: hypothetical protein HUU16_02725 [Candidatus Omnitrophica bacterium]|nr:hypothetical protein [Candidatus Omnitrophota bacterium]
MRRIKKWLLPPLILFVFYFAIVPGFWPRPKVEVRMPRTHPFNRDLEVLIGVRAWHSNLRVVQVRFYVDHYKTTAHGLSGSLDTLHLYADDRSLPHVWHNLDRFTRPYSVRRKEKVPLSDLASEGKVQAGRVVGKVDVLLAYVPRTSRGNRTWNREYAVRTETFSVPFDLSLE